MSKIFGFVLILASFWLISSGMFKPLLLTFGAISIVIVIALIMRMKSKDAESYPIIMPAWRLPGYLLWMIGQIVVSNIDVAKRVWLGKSSISPTIFTVRATQKTDVAKVLYANSITMTPGTVTLSVREDVLEVHALTKAAAEELKKGEMDRRVTALEAA
ncbi:MAG: Na+/H+ antiporter subunit E [Alphaproteobacteria bacterium]|nr:Na+/H+ antiporter subunit E [Alphaproteobacteria bacterium]